MPYNKKAMLTAIEDTFLRIKAAIYTPVKPLNITVYVTKEPVSYEERMTGEKKELKKGESWGKLWDCGWFRFSGEVPVDCDLDKAVLIFDVNGEMFVVDDEGNPIVGLTTVCSNFSPKLGNPGKRIVRLKEFNMSRKIDIWADAGCNDLFGETSKTGIISEADIGICNEEMRCLYYDFEVLYELMKQLSPDSARYNSILFCLYRACSVFLEYSGEEAGEARKILKSELDKTGGTPSLAVSAIGHAHIDLAWYWPIRETIRKGARTFSTAIHNIKKYPDYIFGASQPQLYDWVKTYYPGLYKKIKKAVEEGRWEPQGAMWVEADTNISGGEALIRQLIYGKRFFREEFGKEINILWLPDVFGYTGALPQLLKKTGVDYFLTIKLSWNRHNLFPHHTFRWIGIDGTEVLVHMPPEGEYNSAASPESLCTIERNFCDKGVSENVMMLFGIGDGGGGPGEEHLERLMREKNLSPLPPVKQEMSTEFFERIDKNRDRYPQYFGELYLEKHQGTYTSRAESKKYNRRLEYALHDAEMWSSVADITTDYKYDREQLEQIWKEMLLYQFHDILPGSSIQRVYDESHARYKLLMDETNSITDKALTALTRSDGGYILINSLGWERNVNIKLGDAWYSAVIPSCGMTSELKPYVENIESGCADKLMLENNCVRVRFDESGAIISVFDKRNAFEAIKSSSNLLTVYEDKGNVWDMPESYRSMRSRRFTLVASEVGNDGPQKYVVQIYKHGTSELKQKIVITEGSARVDFITEVDWHESEKMLRTEFDTTVYSVQARCDIQFGSIVRSTLSNTTHDMSHLEICAHKYVDIMQGNRGVVLMNDCKYGYYVKANVIDLNLLRSNIQQGELSDNGRHSFSYAFFPHSEEENIVHESYEFNYPVKVMNGKCDKASYFSVSDEDIIIETVKKSENNQGIIVRMYESSGKYKKADLKTEIAYKKAQLIDIKEDVIEDDFILDNIEFKPYEIITVCICPM